LGDYREPGEQAFLEVLGEIENRFDGLPTYCAISSL